MPQFPTLNLASDTLPAHNATLQPFMKGTGPKPSASFMPNVPVVRVPESKIGAENFMPTLSMNHSVHETFGGSPRWEAEQMAYRPTNPRIMGQAPSVRIDFAPNQDIFRFLEKIQMRNKYANFNNLMDEFIDLSDEIKRQKINYKKQEYSNISEFWKSNLIEISGKRFK